MRVLVVEDDATLRCQLETLLGEQGFVVETAEDGTEGAFQAVEYSLDAAVVDLGLPGRNGLEVIQAAREAGRDYPILILTARDGWQNKVEGLEAGADDYLVKPFHPEELLARLRALLRRTGRWTQSTLHCGPIALDTRAQEVTLDGAKLDLTAYEYRVLEFLMLHAGEVVSKRTLSEHLYAEDDDRDSNVIEVFVRRLRRKLDSEGKLQPIETLRGQGYRLNLPRGDS
ncbi:MAG: response regulator transcription factor [Pseudomonadota bacterium]